MASTLMRRLEQNPEQFKIPSEVGLRITDSGQPQMWFKGNVTDITEEEFKIRVRANKMGAYGAGFETMKDRILNVVDNVIGENTAQDYRVDQGLVNANKDAFPKSSMTGSLLPYLVGAPAAGAGLPAAALIGATTAYTLADPGESHRDAALGAVLPAAGKLGQTALQYGTGLLKTGKQLRQAEKILDNIEATTGKRPPMPNKKDVEKMVRIQTKLNNKDKALMKGGKPNLPGIINQTANTTRQMTPGLLDYFDEFGPTELENNFKY